MFPPMLFEQAEIIRSMPEEVPPPAERRASFRSRLLLGPPPRSPGPQLLVRFERRTAHLVQPWQGRSILADIAIFLPPVVLLVVPGAAPVEPMHPARPPVSLRQPVKRPIG